MDLKKVFDITNKDLLQFIRDRKTFLFFLIMPVAFTFLFGYAFGGLGGGKADSRLPIFIIDEDLTGLSDKLTVNLATSQVVRIETSGEKTRVEAEKELSDGNLAGIVIIPAGFGESLQSGQPKQIILVTESTSITASTIQSEILAVARKLANSVWTATLANQFADLDLETGLSESLQAWETPPLQVQVSTSGTNEEPTELFKSMAHSSPGMMLQFAIAGLLVSAQVIVAERKTHSLQRLLTTPTRRWQILLGHYLAIFLLILAQFFVLVLFGQIILGIDYFSQPMSSLLVMISSAACIAALGLLIGVFAKSEEQAVIFSLIPMFVLAGLGGAWVPLEVTGATFQAIGHLSPVAWAMDGFKNVTVRGLGLQAALLPVLALTGYAVLFFGLAVWKFRKLGE